jgi:predicted HTH transcriptional regulator
VRGVCHSPNTRYATRSQIGPVSYVLKYIEEGEHQQQDFKMRIDDARKIARTVSAFANTDGGRLLIGVKDNGAVAGVRAEEEFHMMEAAAKMYCRPPIDFHVQAWKVDNKTLLEVTIEQSAERPVLAQQEDGTWKAFLRNHDQNFPAPAVMLNVWKSDDHDRPQKYFHTEKEKKIFTVLNDLGEVSQNQIAKLTGIPRPVLTKLLARLIRWDLIAMTFYQDQARYKLK